MIHTYRTPMTPAIARQVVKLAEVNSRVEIDPMIREMARVGLAAPGDFDRLQLSDAGRLAVQELLDFDLRAAVALPNNGPRRVDWARPVLAAIKMRGGIDTILCAGDVEPIDIEWLVKEFFGDAMRVLDFDERNMTSDSLKERSTTVYLHSNMTGIVGGMPVAGGLYQYCILVGLQRMTSGLQMYPHMPTLSSVLGTNSSKLLSRGFKTSAGKIAFLFNVVTALSKDV